MNLKHVTAALAAAALLVPTAATAHHKRDSARAKAKQEQRKGQSKAKNAVFKGVVVSTTAASATAPGSLVVRVEKANRWGRSFKGQDVTFTLTPDTKVNTLDRVADGKAGADDFLANDKVLVQARIKRDAAQPLAARKVNNLTAPKASDGSED